MLPQWGLSEAPADKRFGAYCRQKVHLWWKQFLLIFPRTNVIFCTAAPYEGFFSWGEGSRHHCPKEVGAYGI